jgi:hypothetical protein
MPVTIRTIREEDIAAYLELLERLDTETKLVDEYEMAKILEETSQ